MLCAYFQSYYFTPEVEVPNKVVPLSAEVPARYINEPKCFTVGYK